MDIKNKKATRKQLFYFSGYVLLGIVQIVLEIIFTGGSVSIERLFAKSAEIIKGFIKKAGGFADDIFSSLDKLISLIKKGSQHFADFIRWVFDDFFEWIKGLFKSGKADEVLEEVKRPVKGLSESDLDWMASLKIGNLGGNILKASQIRKLRGLLKEKGIYLIVEGDAKSITRLFAPVEDFRSIDDLFYVMRNEGFPGGFNAHTKQFYLSKNATEIVGFQEMAHFKHFDQIGETYFTLSRLEKETFVWEQILVNRSKWTKAELQDSLNYINGIRIKEYGLEPLKIKI